MGTIGKSDDVSRLKDYYTQREDTIEKKYQNTIEEMKKNHGEDIDRIQNQSSEAVQGLRSSMKEKLSAQDIKHQKEIESLKNLYQKNLEDSKRD